jgi:hypothetical protein
MSIASFFLFVNRGRWLVWNAISVEFTALSFIESYFCSLRKTRQKIKGIQYHTLPFA